MAKPEVSAWISDEVSDALARAYVEYLSIRNPSREVTKSEYYTALSEQVFEAMFMTLETPCNPRSWPFFLRAAEIANETADPYLVGEIGEGFFESWLCNNLDQVAELVSNEARRNPVVREMLGGVILRRSSGSASSVNMVRPYVYGVDETN